MHYLFVNHCTIIINYNFVQAIDARSFDGAKAFCFLFKCQWLSSMPNSFRANQIWQLHHNGFGLITLLSFILLIIFWPFWIPMMVAMHQIVIYIYEYIYIFIYIHIYIYVPVKVKKRMPLKRSTFYDVGNSTPLVGLEPTISRLHIEFH